MTRTLATPLLLCLVLGATAGGVFWYLTRAGSGTSTDTSPTSRPASHQNVATNLRATNLGGPVPSGTTIDVSRSIRMPDGKYLPALNGVLNPPNLSWPKARPYSPVVSTERDPNGQDWYVHADGSKSTMKVVDVTRSGRVSREAVSWVATPEAALPVRNDPAPRPEAAGSREKR